MAQIHFNRIYIIESLQAGEKQTGSELHNDLLKRMNYIHSDFLSILCRPKNRQEWDQVFANILADCGNNRNSPIIHFEVHGSPQKDGLVLTSREPVKWEELYQQLYPINKTMKNELFVTWAVCHGNFFMSSSFLNRPAAFRGMVGSFETIYVSDLTLRFYEFYEELFHSFDLNKAYEALAKANPDKPNSFRCYSAELIFALTWEQYSKELSTEAELERRARELYGNNTDELSRYGFTEDSFIDHYKNNKDVYTQRVFEQDYDTYFMLDIYPELKDTIECPRSISEIMTWLEQLRNAK